MVTYKSLCKQTKTFHGVTFNYGDVKSVKGYIHDKRFVCLGTAVETQESDSEEVKTTAVKEIVKKEPLKEQPKKVGRPRKESASGKSEDSKTITEAEKKTN